MPAPFYLESYGHTFYKIIQIIEEDGFFHVPVVDRKEGTGLQRLFYGWRTAMKRGEKSLDEANTRRLRVALESTCRVVQKPEGWKVEFERGRDLGMSVALAIRERELARKAQPSKAQGAGHAGTLRDTPLAELGQLALRAEPVRQAEMVITSEGAKTPQEMSQEIYLQMTPQTFAMVEFLTREGTFLGTGWTGYLGWCLEQGCEPSGEMMARFGGQAAKRAE